jgi:hypothetical protein
MIASSSNSRPNPKPRRWPIFRFMMFIYSSSTSKNDVVGTYLLLAC